ncbi:hypothetical protein [Streptomyces sp. NPDC057403]|uniref:hypothetical protein n=1 Tax=Streptomyces sp. NPDC057403 TaxID=3346119 RepID=UPI0036D07A4B
MENFGRFEFDPSGSTIDSSTVWSELQAPFLEFARSDPKEFSAALADAVSESGGFAWFGAARTIWNLVGSDFRCAAYDRVRLAALEFLRSNGVPASRVSAHDMNFWREQHDEPWLTGPPAPPLPTPVTPLAPGESRLVARLTPARDANTVYVQAAPGGGYRAVLEMSNSSEDSTRLRRDWLGAGTLRDLYTRIGGAFQVPVHWVADELEPFIPLPPSRL